MAFVLSVVFLNLRTKYKTTQSAHWIELTLQKRQITFMESPFQVIQSNDVNHTRARLAQTYYPHLTWTDA